MAEQRSEKHEVARNSLSEDLLSAFDDLVADYRFAATKHHCSPFVSYIVLADLVRAGWRLTEEPDVARKRAREMQKVLWDAGGVPKDLAEIFYSMDRWEVIASGYRKAGDLLCDVFANTVPQETGLLFPIFFCYRHFLELGVKSLIYLNAQKPSMTGTKTSLGHFLDNLWRALDGDLSEDAKSTTIWQDVKIEDGKLIGGVQTGDVSEDLALLRDWCGRFANVDPKSDRFRYPESREGKPYEFPDLQSLFGLDDIEKLKSELARLGVAVHNISIAINAEMEHG